MSDDIVKNEIFSDVILLAKSKQILVVLVYPEGFLFPSPYDIRTLNIDVQRVFNSIPVPLNDFYVEHCWKTISDKIFDRVKVINYFTCLFLTL